MKRSIIVGLLLVTGCSDYNIEKIPPDLGEGSEDMPESEESDPVLETNEVEVLDPPIQVEEDEEVEEPEEEPEEEPCGGASTDDCDLDGYSPEDGDCDDANPVIHPFAGDTYGDGVDQDCDLLDCEADASGDMYYAFCPDERLNWAESFDLCVEHGYDALGSVYDEGAQISFNLLLQDSGLEDQESPWVDMNPVGDGYWGSGEPVSYTNWAEGEPNGGSDFCGHINRDFDGNGRWNDVPCSDTVWSLTCQVSF